MSDRSRERDLVLAPNEYAFISDQTKGNINVYVGPYKTSLANTDQPVYFDARSKRFIRCNLEEATLLFAVAPEGWYTVLKNPSRDGEQPTTGTVNNLGPLQIGHKVNLPGPSAFALWPGQMTRVLKGHQIRSNQYLLVRVYDEESARQNWSSAVIKPQSPDTTDTGLPEAEEDLTMGKTIVIKGTEVSFYIPPTGVEVIPDQSGNYVREAVTLERLEYCILLDEDGNKRFIQGPAVVFPEPTELFIERHGSRKFRAIELNELSGIYVKVIAPYSEGEGDFVVGQELFITGKEQMIYFPRPEHAIIKYGQRELHHAVAIPAGEGRYCLDRSSGKIRLVRGPQMFLPDPRHEVIVRRVLSNRQVKQWFPGNREALTYNQQLRAVIEERQSQGNYIRAEDLVAGDAEASEKLEEANRGFAGDEISRKTQFSPPRMITLDTKYDGAVNISPWTGYAVKVVSKSGERKVIVGPQSYLLAYDETLETISFSTGTPKSDDAIMNTVYLRVKHNKVSDVVEAETADLCRVSLLLSYRVNFEGDSDRWFDVENYVKFLTDHMRSLLRNAIKQLDVQTFYANSIGIIRDAVLGASVEGGARAGRNFEENGMRIYDVEVLDVTLGDARIEKMLTDAQHAVVNQTLELANEQRQLDFVERSEEIKRSIQETRAATTLAELELELTRVQRELAVRSTRITAEKEVQDKQLAKKLAQEQGLNQINELELTRQRSIGMLAVELEAQRLEQRLAELRGEVDATVQKAGAVSPDLIAALQAFGDREMVERVSASMAPLAILGGESVASVLSKLLAGTPLERVAKMQLDSHSFDDESDE